MKTETISYQVGDDAFDAFIARPDESGDRPAVLVCHAWGGRKDFEEGKARMLAELGYVGAAIDVYGVGKRATGKEECQALMSPLLDNPERLRTRLETAFDKVRGLDGVDRERTGAIGFCFGGLCALLLARMGLPLRGVVSFHGLLKVTETQASKAKARVLVLHGQDDPMVPASDVSAFTDEMKRLGAEWQLHAYPGVMHAFTNPDANDPDFGTVYDPRAARRAWFEMQRFFHDVGLS